MRPMKSKLSCFVIIALATSLFMAMAEGQSTNAPVVAELSLQAKGDLTRITVYLINTSNASRTLFTGLTGSSGVGKFDAVDLDEAAKEPPVGVGSLVMPELTFGSFRSTAPTPVSKGITFRSMKPTLLELR